MNAMDYRFSDPYLDPIGFDESVYSEQTIRLPDSFWCYDPLDGKDLPVSSLPAARNQFVTFGSLNNLCKISDGILSLWAQVLREIKDSRLLLLASGTSKQRMLDRLHREGIDPSRIEFAPRQGRRAYLQIYHRIDIGLDTFPYNGHTTSLDSFWMGVPVVTLVGQTVVSRAGWCQLSNLGLSELAALSPHEFVRIAIDLARDIPRLTNIHSTLRQRMQTSPLMDAPRFARNVESAYRQIWKTFCLSKGDERDIPSGR
jgi:predicted O-linked N-acetylglucosamine transferase (SPINDLY family)